MEDTNVQYVLLKMITYFGSDVKRINHALKVYTFAKNIAALEGLPVEKVKIIEISSILHDIGIKESERKYNSSAGNYQEIEGPEIALMLLKEFALPQNLLERICFLIGNHHTYNKIDDLDFQILVEADFLVNIFEDSYDEELIENILNKYFKTESGRTYLNSLYLSKYVI